MDNQNFSHICAQSRKCVNNKSYVEMDFTIFNIFIQLYYRGQYSKLKG